MGKGGKKVQHSVDNAGSRNHTHSPNDLEYSNQGMPESFSDKIRKSVTGNTGMPGDTSGSDVNMASAGSVAGKRD